jgi:hypothetical protein
MHAQKIRMTGPWAPFSHGHLFPRGRRRSSSSSLDSRHQHHGCILQPLRCCGTRTFKLRATLSLLNNPIECRVANGAGRNGDNLPNTIVLALLLPDVSLCHCSKSNNNVQLESNQSIYIIWLHRVTTWFEEGAGLGGKVVVSFCSRLGRRWLLQWVSP